MYQPPHHREDRLEVQHGLIESHPLGLLISNGPSGLLANAIPFKLQRQQGALGTLQAHLARANPQWKELADAEVLIVFQGPQNYISPSHYETKRETGKVVPTWNYAIVQARGPARLMDDAAWIERQINALTRTHEQQRTHAWEVDDAPRAFIESQMKGIVGIEIEIASIEGKWKVSQNRPEGDRRGVAAGLAGQNPAMEQLVKQYGKLED